LIFYGNGGGANEDHCNLWRITLDHQWNNGHRQRFFTFFILVIGLQLMNCRKLDDLRLTTASSVMLEKKSILDFWKISSG
jgi:hypothetical protein